VVATNQPCIRMTRLHGSTLAPMGYNGG
jgi:hypothetical protein